MEEELCDIFQDEKIFNKVCFLTYYTTVDALLSLYDKFGKKNVSIYDLLKMVGQQKDVRGDYSELIYEYQFNSFDENEFNREVKPGATKIILFKKIGKTAFTLSHNTIRLNPILFFSKKTVQASTDSCDVSTGMSIFATSFLAS